MQAKTPSDDVACIHLPLRQIIAVKLYILPIIRGSSSDVMCRPSGANCQLTCLQADKQEHVSCSYPVKTTLLT